LFLLLGKNQSSLLSIFKKLLNPPIMALFAGLFFGLTDIKINSMVLSGITTLGAMTTPLAMIFVGGMLSQIKSIKWYGKELTSLIATRLIIVPLFMFVLIKIFGIAGVTASVILLEAATPTMVNAPLLYQRYKGEAVFSTSAVFITTLLCIITIPVLMLLL
jgi:predicted permease